MIYRSPQNPNSHLTVKERQWPSFPAKQLLQRGLIRGAVLDFGCGTGVDVVFLRDRGFTVTGYDPHYAPDYPQGKFDTILCLYVLNVLLPEEQAVVLMAISELLKPTGRAYFAVRRDIKYSGFRTHAKHGVPVYQCNVVLPYHSILQMPHCEIYEYRHFNQLGQLSGACPFCVPEPERELLTESATAYAPMRCWTNTLSPPVTLWLSPNSTRRITLPCLAGSRRRAGWWWIASNGCWTSVTIPTATTSASMWATRQGRRCRTCISTSFHAMPGTWRTPPAVCAM